MRKADDTITVKAEEWTCNCNELIFPVNKKVFFVWGQPLDLSHLKVMMYHFQSFFIICLNPALVPFLFRTNIFVSVSRHQKCAAVPFSLHNLELTYAAHTFTGDDTFWFVRFGLNQPGCGCDTFDSLQFVQVRHFLWDDTFWFGLNP